eukprot:759830_1
MGNVVDKTVRGLSPVTWAAAAFDAKESYYCPVCGREVWAYGHMVGTKCKGCPGRRATAQTISNLQSTVSTQSSTINTYKTAHTTMEDEQKKQSESADKKRKEFVPKVDEITNKYSSNSEAKEDSPAD